MKKAFFIVCFAVLAIGANAQQEGFQKTPQGTSFKFLLHNQGDRLKQNDVITFRMIQKTEKDSILTDDYRQAQIQPTGDLMDVFPLLTLKDSILVKVPTDSIFKTHEAQRPPFFPKGSNLMVVISIEREQTISEAIDERNKLMAEQKAMIEKYQAEEDKSTTKYITDHKLLLKTTPSGLKYKLTKITVKRKPLQGDTVYVNYVGRTLDGKVFDTSIQSEAKKAGLDQPGRPYEPLNFVVGQGQVIPGWDEGLKLLAEGSKATFIIPSKLAYGPKGAGDMIKPFSTLLFDVELVKIKPTKHVITKSVVKKRTTVKKQAVTAKKH